MPPACAKTPGTAWADDPTISVNRSARTERELPTSRANCSTVHCSLGCACKAASAWPTSGSRSPASQPVCAGGRVSRYRRMASTNSSSERRARTFSPPARALPDSFAAMLSRVPSHPRRGLHVRSREVDHRRQGREERIERTLVAAQEATDDSRAIRPSAAELVKHRQRRRCASKTLTCRASTACLGHSRGHEHRRAERR